MCKRIIFVLTIVFSFCSIVIVHAEENELQITKAVWAYAVHGEGDYEANVSGIFSRGERGYAYLEVEGFRVEQDNDIMIDIEVDVVLKTQGGFRLFRQNNLVEYKLQTPAHPPTTIWFYIWVDIPFWAPRSTYIAEVIIRDIGAGVIVTEQQEITVQ